MESTKILKPKSVIRLRLIANKAAPSPLLGQSLGQYGINIMDFCKKFNAKSRNLKENFLIPVKIVIYSKNNFDIQIKTPSSSYLLKKITGIEKGSSLTKKQNLMEFILLKELYHLAVLKKCDYLLNHLKIKSICKTLIGTAKSIGILIAKDWKSGN